ncbi:MAG: hypothetical protein II085_03090, partial [Alphaproteobacteria bacterium]|nr:hypothetical protein [Alphaproteobacteria bacterium]
MIKVEEKGLYGNFGAGHDKQKRIVNTNRLNAAAYSACASSPSFSGKELSAIQKQFLALFSNKEARLYKFMEKASDFIKGEMGGIVITAVGTGLVAPFPIAFNPFVKAKPGATQEEKDEVRRTKAYSAWRQPISAVIALLIQAGVQKPIDRFLQNLTNDAETAAKWRGDVLNQTSLNDEDYLKRKIKGEFKDGTLKFEDGKIYDMSQGSDAVKIGEAKDLKEAISTVQKQRTKSQLETIAKTLESDGVIRMGNFNIDSNITAEVVNDSIDKYIEAITDMKNKPQDIDFHTRRAEVLINNEHELDKLI